MNNSIRNPCKYCSIRDCTVNSIKNPEIRFFNYPSGANIERFNKWAEFSQNPRIINRELKRGFVCALHFDDSQYCSSLKNKLLLHAVPTQFCGNISPRSTSESVLCTKDRLKVNNDKNKSVPNSPEISHGDILSTQSDISSVSQGGSCSKNSQVQTNSSRIKTSGDHLSHRLKQSLQTQVSTSNKYEIGVSVVKTINANEDIEKLKKKLVKQVDQIFQSIACKKTSVIEKKLLIMNPANGKDFTVLVNTDNDDIVSKCDMNSDESKRNVHDFNRSSDTSCTVNQSECRTLTEKQLTVNPSYVTVSSSVLCSKCGLILRNEYCFSNHNRIHHEEKKCEQCDLILPSLLEYRQHRRKHKNDFLKQEKMRNRLLVNNFHCNICNKNCKNRQQLLRHKLALHNIGEYFCCDLCDKKCTSNYHLTVHKKKIHKVESVTKVCPHCGRKFSSKQCFTTHLSRVHTNKKYHICPICIKIFKSM